MLKGIRLLGLSLMLMGLAACGAAKIPHLLVADYDKRAPRLIAVMAVKNTAKEPRAAELLRTKLVEALYFKGYPRIPVIVIDGLVAQLSASGVSPTVQQIGEKLQVDAVLLTTLKAAGPGRGLFYASTEVAADFELKSAKTGETLWQVKYAVTQRSFGITPKRVELQSSQDYEPAIQEVLDKALSTLPDAGS